MIQMKNNIRELFEQIENSDKICIIGHIAPDGDCIGSVMALYEFIKTSYEKKEVYVGFDGKIPYNLTKYIDSDIVLNNCDNNHFGLIVILDCSDEGRLGKYAALLECSDKTICIDHHITNNSFADINLIDGKMSSTGEFLYHILKSADKQINLKMAEYIYVAIVTDTGKFAYDSTSADTHNIAADLIKIGVDVSKINNELYNSKPINIVKAYIECISNISFYHNNKLGIAKIDKATIKKNDIDMNDIDGVAEFIREVSEIEVSCVLKEYDTDDTKVSLRSKNDIDVAKISQTFGGGGHQHAAGFQVKKSLNEAEQIVVKELEKYLGV